MEDLPRRAAARTVRLAGLPLGYAGRATLGLRPAALVRVLPGDADPSLFHKVPPGVTPTG